MPQFGEDSFWNRQTRRQFAEDYIARYGMAGGGPAPLEPEPPTKPRDDFEAVAQFEGRGAGGLVRVELHRHIAHPRFERLTLRAVDEGVEVYWCADAMAFADRAAAEAQLAAIEKVSGVFVLGSPVLQRLRRGQGIPLAKAPKGG